MADSFDILPDNLPRPENDGLCDHLLEMSVPDMSFLSVKNTLLSLPNFEKKFVILYFFPEMASNKNNLPINWDSIPGARGCTPQNISFSQNMNTFLKYDAFLIGISTQSSEELYDVSLRRKLSQEIVSDTQLLLKTKLDIPVFDSQDKTRYKRLTVILNKSKIIKVFYPIFSPDKHVFEVLDWLQHNFYKY